MSGQWRWTAPDGRTFAIGHGFDEGTERERAARSSWETRIAAAYETGDLDLGLAIDRVIQADLARRFADDFTSGGTQ